MSVKTERGWLIRPNIALVVGGIPQSGAIIILHWRKKFFFAVGPSPAEIIPSPRYGRRANSLWALWPLNYSGPGAQAAALSSVRCGVRCLAGQASRIETLGNSS